LSLSTRSTWIPCAVEDDELFEEGERGAAVSSGCKHPACPPCCPKASSALGVAHELAGLEELDVAEN
jgi:hypothetical protein